VPTSDKKKGSAKKIAQTVQRLYEGRLESSHFRGRSQDDIDYERALQELTFKPNTSPNKVSNHSSPDRAKNHNGVPLLILDINMGDLSHRLTIHSDEDYKSVVSDFSQKLGLNHREQKKVLNVVKDQLNSAQLQSVDESEEREKYC
jgi:hypothetical protein